MEGIPIVSTFFCENFLSFVQGYMCTESAHEMCSLIVSGSQI